jgi:hypothetical protein
MEIKLSNNINNIGWEELRKVLDDNVACHGNWQKAISILNDRVTKRYFEPLCILINIPSKGGEGFSIVTIECALIEFLAACRTGMIYKNNFNRNHPSYYYNRSGDFFKTFLESADVFSEYFPSKFDADDFYTNVRCALLHEAYTRNGWTINTTEKLADDKTNTVILESSLGKKKIYRTALFHTIQNYFNKYIKELDESNAQGQELRKYLGRKLDQICEVTVDGKYWWE